LRYSGPVYSVGTKIVIRDSRRGGMVNSELAFYERMGFLEASNKNVENEMEVIRSRNLVETVVIQEELFIRYSVKGRIKDTDLYGGMGSLFYASPPVTVFLDKNSISALRSTLSLKISMTQDSVIVVNGQYGKRTFNSEFISLPGVINTPIGELFLLPDAKVNLIREYPLSIDLMSPLRVARSYISSLSTRTASDNSSVIRISVEETNPVRGENFLKRLINVYNEETMDDKNRAAQSASDYVTVQLKELKKELLLSEKDVETFKRDNKIAPDLSVEAGIFIREDNELTKQLASLETEDNVLNFLYKEIDKEVDVTDPLPSTLLISNPALAASLERYNQRIIERNRILNYTITEVPLVKRSNERLDLMKKDILATIRTAQNDNNIMKKEVRSMLSKYYGSLGDIPRKERELNELLRESVIQTGLYTNLLRFKQDIGFTQSATTPTAKIIDDPILMGLISPRKMYTLLLSLMFGFIFPYIIIGLRELLNYRLTREDEVRRFSDMPVIVSLPIVKTKSPVVVTSHATSGVVERFRLLRTNLQFLLDTSEKKSILITSTISGEGKTFIAINLALTFSLKYKTILVGLDIRRPKINNFLNLPKQMGLISYLAGEETDLNNLIYKNVNDSNLDVLVSGLIPLNPNELLIEKTLDSMFEKLREQYDFIIVDSSPIGSVSDAFLVNRVSDVSLFVVRNNLTPKSALSLANMIYEENRLQNMNLVLNGFAEGKGKYGYGYGGYGYGYGYGYGGYGYGYGYGYDYESKS